MAGSEGAEEPTTTAASATTPAESKTKRAEAEQGTRGRGEAPVSSAAQEVEVNCLMNARYHASREAFLDGVHRWFMFGVVLAGAGSVTEILATLDHAQFIAGALAAVLGAADLTFDLSNRARAHSLMKRRYFELLADMGDGEKTPKQAAACLHRYNADEEPAFFALLMRSWNAAQEMVYGEDADLMAIPRWHLFLQNFWRFSGATYEPLTGGERGG